MAHPSTAQSLCLPANLSMTLLQLPPELLLRIFDFVGPQFFREDIERLTVSKQWYEVAWEVFSGHLTFTAESLIQFIQLMKSEDAFKRYQPHVSAVDLNFQDEEEDFSEEPTYRGNPEDDNHDTVIFNAALAELAILLRRCRGLRRLTLRAELGSQEQTWLPMETYVMARPLADLLSVRYLTVLDLDTTGSFPSNPHSRPRIHICRSISALLPSLRRLRCRMDTICEKLLECPLHGDTDADDTHGMYDTYETDDTDGTDDIRKADSADSTHSTHSADDITLRLTEVIINLCTPQPFDGLMAHGCPYRCQADPSELYQELIEVMERQATTLARRLNNPRMVRVISHTLTTIAFDAITGRRLQLEDGADWDADGELVEERGHGDEDPEARDLSEGYDPGTPHSLSGSV